MEEEILDVVEEKDQFVRKATRKEVRENALMHRLSRVIIKNNKNQLFVQKRSANKKNFPEHWDIGIAETVVSGEGYVSAAMRGLVEEVGIIGVSNIQLIHSFLFKIKYNSSEINELCKVYQLEYNGKLTIQEEEIEDAKFLTINEINNLLKNGPSHPVGKIAFE